MEPIMQSDGNSPLLTLSEVAAFLQLSEKTVLKMVKQSEIPCMKIANQWRFSKMVLDDWVLSKMGVIPQNDLSRLIEQEYDVVPLSRLVHEENVIINLKGRTVSEVLAELAENAFRTNLVADRQRFFDKLVERERMSSTAIGEGIALPHLRTPSDTVVREARIVIGTSEAGIDFNSLDSKPIHLIFLPISDSEVVHLRIIAKLSQLLREQRRVETLKMLKSRKDFVSFFISYNQELLNKEIIS